MADRPETRNLTPQTPKSLHLANPAPIEDGAIARDAARPEHQPAVRAKAIVSIEEWPCQHSYSVRSCDAKNDLIIYYTQSANDRRCPPTIDAIGAE